MSSYYMSTSIDCVDDTLVVFPVAECLSTSDGSDYRGNIQKTKTGKICQDWSSQKVYSNAVHLPINHYTLRINR